MRFDLTRHPDRPSAVTAVQAEVSRTRGGALSLRYAVADPQGALVLPAAGLSGRADGLWRRTCFEAFVRRPAGYYELNLSPSGQWAAYRFDGYRAGMAAAGEVANVAIAAARVPGRFELAGSLDLSGLADLPAGPWRLALSAVIEDMDGLSYWALAHPPGAADFHHDAGFVGEA